jgi:aryl-alcohol dehydrogenase-like predicted oxidoreductase
VQTARLGLTDLRVSRLAFGTWQLGGDWGDFDERAAIAAIRRARDLGINLFDTAQGYGFGAAEQLLGRALRHELDHRRDDIVIATTGGLRMTGDGLVRDCSPTWLRCGVWQSLRALGVDHIDLYQVHWPDTNVPFEETAGALQQLVDEGKIRHVGVSNYSVAQATEFARTRPVETLQPAYNLFARGFEEALAPYALEHDIGVLAYGPLAHGLLSGTMSEHTAIAPGDWRRQSPLFHGASFRRNLETVHALERFAQARGATVSQLAIAWTLANHAVDVAIVGARSAAHIEESSAAAELELTAADLVEIDAIVSSAVGVPGPSPPGLPR